MADGSQVHHLQHDALIGAGVEYYRLLLTQLTICSA